jgi:hypothetical protein
MKIILWKDLLNVSEKYLKEVMQTKDAPSLYPFLSILFIQCYSSRCVIGYQVIRVVQYNTSFIVKITCVYIYRLHVSAHWSHHQAFNLAQIQVLYYSDPKSLQDWSILLTFTVKAHSRRFNSVQKKAYICSG